MDAKRNAEDASKPTRCLQPAAGIRPDFFHLDLEVIWTRDWLFVGHDREVANPGTFFTFEIGEYRWWWCGISR
jgi:phenylpropionate dioxygenase-like ring-hydroxylating dioxygenase large terminal subunit